MPSPSLSIPIADLLHNLQDFLKILSGCIVVAFFHVYGSQAKYGNCYLVLI